MLTEFLFNLMTYPIRYFWIRYVKLCEEKAIVKAILLLIASILGLISIWGLLFLLVYYICINYMEVVLCVFAIAWLFLFVKSRMDNPTNGSIILPEEDELRRKAEDGYMPMLNMFYQSIIGKSSDLGVHPPMGIKDVELSEEKFLIMHNVAFYRYKLYKCDVLTPYSTEELNEYKHILQATISRKLNLGDFAGYRLEKYRDKYGSFWDPIVVESINDVGTFLLVTLVYASPEYSEYLHKKDITEQIVNGQQVPFNKSWGDK